MKQVISDSEKDFIVEGMLQGTRRDGRGCLDSRNFQIKLGTIPHAFGSATLHFGEAEVQIICAIKAELQKPLPSYPTQGQIRYHLESAQSSSSGRNDDI